jgi:RNA polymerase sigma factor (sigma-70 family)
MDNFKKVTGLDFNKFIKENEYIKFYKKNMNIDLDDCYQNASINLYNNINNFNPEKSSLKTFFNLIFSSECLKENKRVNNYARIQYTYLNLNDCDEVEEYNQQKFEWIKTYLKTITDDIIIDFFLNKYSYKELEEKYNININTLKSKINYFKIKTRDLYNKKHI